MTEPLVVDVQGVTKRYAGHTAVRDLSLQVPRGTIYGLLGPNGAGKTTTIRMIMDIIIPDEGSVALFGEAGGGAIHTLGFREENQQIGYLHLLVQATLFGQEGRVCPHGPA